IVVGPLVKFEELLCSQVGIALEKGGNVPLLHLIFHVEPRLPAHGLYHGVQRLSRLPGVLLRRVVCRLRLRTHRMRRHQRHCREQHRCQFPESHRSPLSSYQPSAISPRVHGCPRFAVPCSLIPVPCFYPTSTAPPFTFSTSPEMNPASGVQRKTIGPAISRAVATRPSGIAVAIFSPVAGSASVAAVMSVATHPGATQFTRIPLGASSVDRL